MRPGLEGERRLSEERGRQEVERRQHTRAGLDPHDWCTNL